jgi:hypothetical protein
MRKPTPVIFNSTFLRLLLVLMCMWASLPTLLIPFATQGHSSVVHLTVPIWGLSFSLFYLSLYLLWCHSIIPIRFAIQLFILLCPSDVCPFLSFIYPFTYSGVIVLFLLGLQYSCSPYCACLSIIPIMYDNPKPSTPATIGPVRLGNKLRANLKSSVWARTKKSRRRHTSERWENYAIKKVLCISTEGSKAA